MCLIIFLLRTTQSPLAKFTPAPPLPNEVVDKRSSRQLFKVTWLLLTSVLAYFPCQSTSCSFSKSTEVRKLQVRSYTMSLAWYAQISHIQYHSITNNKERIALIYIAQSNLAFSQWPMLDNFCNGLTGDAGDVMVRM